jgi:pimeloyl-[acyl-carrier protein] methyl ester esterase
MKTFVVNGWASSVEAWDLCSFPRDRVYSYVEALDGVFERDLARSDSAVCVGWSMGASVVLQNVVRYSEKIKALVLLAGTPRMMAAPGWRGMNERRLSALKKGLEISIAQHKARRIAGDITFSPYADDSAENLVRGLDFLRSLDCREALSGRSNAGAFDEIEVRIFQSYADAVVPVHNAHFLKSVFPKSQLLLVDGAEHALPVSIPGLIDEAYFDVVSKL